MSALTTRTHHHEPTHILSACFDRLLLLGWRLLLCVALRHVARATYDPVMVGIDPRIVIHPMPTGPVVLQYPTFQIRSQFTPFTTRPCRAHTKHCTVRHTATLECVRALWELMEAFSQSILQT
jgi:hypothetical protein